MAWDPRTYQRFSDERSRPFVDLVRRVQARLAEDHDVSRVADLGCGTGHLTAMLAETWPRARVTGIDSSSEMLAAAGGTAEDDRWGGRLSFALGDVREWRSAEPVDVLVTNATLQWVPGHAELLPRWVDTLAPGGVLGLQVPGNHSAPSHALLRETITDGPWASRLGPLVRGGASGTEAVHAPEEYAELLFSAGCDEVDTWETTYVHVLDPAGEDGDDAVLRWVSGTALRPFLDALQDEGERTAFVDSYAERLRGAYPRASYGTPFRFRRIFAVGRRRR
jgi:trans-aconitate 2-methyltransferase